MRDQTFDFIVVGAGSSGATVASRLSERIDGSILLLEAGAPHQNDFWVKVPIGIAKILNNPRYVWQFKTEAQPSLGGRQIYWPRGLLPGGSSSVNGMIFSRGEPAEYNHWRDQGNTGWGYDDLLPYFIKLESTAIGEDKYRGRSGPIHVSSLAQTPNELADAFVQACQQAGIPIARDYNGSQYEGVSYLQLSTHNGRRCSTAVGYLKTPRPNLSLQTEAIVSKVLFKGKRAIGVEYLRGGETCRAYANREIILSAGPIKSPQILELSGVGDAQRLQQLGVPVVQHLPGVGENLVDHVQSRMTFACTKAITLNDILSSRVRQGLMGAQYLLTRRGPMSASSASVHALARTSFQEPRPDVKIQLHHLSGVGRYTTAKNGYGLDNFPGFSIGFFQLRPESRGYVHCCSTNPLEAPVIDPRYLDTEHDRQAMIKAIRLSRDVAQQSALAPYIERETRPGASLASDQELLRYIRESGETSWHPIGTCKMGVDERAVVNPKLLVHGLHGLRVVDSSIMPTMPSSNTNSGSIMIGEKAADMILQADRDHL